MEKIERVTKKCKCGYFVLTFKDDKDRLYCPFCEKEIF